MQNENALHVEECVDKLCQSHEVTRLGVRPFLDHNWLLSINNELRHTLLHRSSDSIQLNNTKNQVADTAIISQYAARPIEMSPQQDTGI